MSPTGADSAASTWPTPTPPNGNRLTEAGTDPVTGQRVNETYGYDRINRLLCITNNDDSTHSIAYAYDADGNRTDEIVGTIHVSTDSSGNPVYIDANGNSLVTVVTAISNTPYLYGIRNELLETADSSGGFIIFDYDHNLMRVKEIISTGEGNSQETRYLYDGNVTVLEYTSNGQTTTKYNYGNNLVSMVDATQPGRPTQFYLLDGLGSTVNMTDQTGNILDSYEYDAWGNIRASAGSSQSGKLYKGNTSMSPEPGWIISGHAFTIPRSVNSSHKIRTRVRASNPLSINRYILFLRQSTQVHRPNRAFPQPARRCKRVRPRVAGTRPRAQRSRASGKAGSTTEEAPSKTTSKLSSSRTRKGPRLFYNDDYANIQRQ